MNWAVVIPSNRPDSLQLFLEAWDQIFHQYGVTKYIIYDNEDGWKDIPEFIPRHSDMIRSWGFFQAWEQGHDAILTLDDDVRPIDGIDIFKEYEDQFYKAEVSANFFNVATMTNSNEPMRGFPREKRIGKLVAVQYGGWDGNLDYDAHLAANASSDGEFYRMSVAVPQGIGVTGCIMNTAFLSEFTPIMWQLPLLRGRYNRYGDIWSGFFIKKTLDLCGLACVINGKASVFHTKKSDILNNYKREFPGLKINDGLWDAIDSIDNLQSFRYDDCSMVYKEVTDLAIAYFKKFDDDYASYFKNAREQWMRLFN